MSDFTQAVAFKNALYAAAISLWGPEADDPDPDVQISYGHPGQNQQNDIVAFMDWSTIQTPVTLGPRRQRDEDLRCTVMFSVYRGGGPEMEKVVTDRLVELSGALEEYTRVTDTTLGGAVLWCFLESFESNGATDAETLASGRLIEATAVFVARSRVSE